MTTLYLASTSPRRKALLEQIGVEFEVIDGIQVDETPLPLENAKDCALRLAQDKARVGWQRVNREGAAVLGADTVVLFEGNLLDKPASRAQALANLQRLSGNTHVVITAVALCTSAGVKTQAVTTQVTFRQLSTQHLEQYIATGEPFDKAGGYGIQGFGAALVSAINGCYSNVVGLPLAQTAQMLEDAGVAMWQSDQ